MENDYITSFAGNELLLHYKEELARAVKRKDKNRQEVVLSVIGALRPDLYKKIKKRE